MTLYREVGTINTFIEPAAPVVRPAPVPVPQPDELKALVEKSLDDDQAEDVVVIDLAGKTTIADYMIVASGRNTRHIAAMAMKLADRMKQAGLRGVEVEGLNQCDWVLVDAGDVIIHLFRPEVRTFYNIEKMWGLETPRPSAERMSA
ncbi:ribosome silencing factor [Azospirillum brasilense]|uniref:Ribosomal silencing factor RsfS n=2 Tax=Azospirillum TaxID=191 RepID=A0A4D8QDF3_AZOBR|nr:MULTISPECIES: ribosome silencing factor [Azospirillum]MBB3262479.1 ribosome-associated protein [Azospirillum sp. OGB3]MBY3752178.1 ribosome silencing factor [Azospirillum formosense]MDW7552446.1 ribosome silencing factor [Azospirillum brasilense]MDW7592364.1 ribosome silencing factor [Azospirillum brasilense]MDW7627494.1 ribosome silencing factor [Azospirillum brasilense]